MKTLYYTAWTFNRARVVSRLAELVAEKGGRVKPLEPTEIVNRTALQGREQYAELVEKFAEHPTEDAHALTARAEHLAELEHFNTEDTEPITVSHTTYISFVLGGNCYYFQFEENPLFGAKFSKSALENGKINRDAYLVTDEEQKWFMPPVWESACSNEDIDKSARALLEMLENAPLSGIWRDTKKRRVRNTYNSGYHYETITAPSRYEELTW